MRSRARVRRFVRAGAGGVSYHLTGDGGREHGVAGGHPAHGLDDLGGRRILQDESGRAGPQGPQHLLVGVERGQDHDLRWVAAGAQPFRRRQAVRAGHAHVHEHHVRPGPVDQRVDVAAVGRLSDDLDVGGTAQHQGQPGSHQRIVVDEEHSDRGHGTSRPNRRSAGHTAPPARGTDRAGSAWPTRRWQDDRSCVPRTSRSSVRPTSSAGVSCRLPSRGRARCW
jgi:hypothetical protein